jgi:hypothetical protein
VLGWGAVAPGDAQGQAAVRHVLRARAVLPNANPDATSYVELTVLGRHHQLPGAAQPDLDAAMRHLLRASVIDAGEEPPDVDAIIVGVSELPQIDWSEGGDPNGRLTW